MTEEGHNKNESISVINKKGEVTESWNTMEDFIKDLNSDTKQNWLDRKFPKGIFHYRTTHALMRPWIIFRGVIDELTWAWQRVFRGWDDRVVWGLDMYLAEMIPKWLALLKDEGFGVPVSMFEDGDFDENYNPTEEATNRAVAKYNEILDDISLGFKCYATGDLWDISNPNQEFMKSNFDHAFQLLHEHFSILYD